MFKVLLSTARSNFTAHQREEEIRHLDIDPEEYVLLRDDKTEMAVELLKAILEKLKVPKWEVDEGTFRIVRISESLSTRKSWALALTSDTRRFHLKVYRDFDGELEEVDLGACRGICAAIDFVEKQIQTICERKMQEAEMFRLAAAEQERLRKEEELARIAAAHEEERLRKEEELASIVAKIEQINQKCRSIYAKELAASKLGEELLIRATDHIALKVAKMSQAQVILPAGDDVLSVKSKFEGKRFKLIDNVPCEFNDESNCINVANAYITSCIDGRNLILPKCAEFIYIDEAHELVMNYVDADLPSSIQDDRLPPRTINVRTNPLIEIDKILTKVERMELNARSDLANISIFSIDLKISSFKELIKTIDRVLGEIEENVNLIIWNENNAIR